MSTLLSWARALTDLVYPRNCQICATAVAAGETGVLCPACLGSVKFIEPPCCQRCGLPFAGQPAEIFACGYCQERPFYFARTICATRAEGVVRAAILGLKYNQRLYFAPHLADWLVRVARDRIDWTTVDAVVPVPLHPRKQRERGFNQAGLLTDALRRAFGVPVLGGALRRVRDTPTQTALGAADRVRNMRQAFVVPRPALVAGRRLVLVDDVFTTGVTLNSCAKVLRQADAREVIALTVARGL